MKLKLALLLCAMMLTAAAQNHFVSGTAWVYEKENLWWPMYPTRSTIELVDTVTRDGEVCMMEKIHRVEVDPNYVGEAVLIEGVYKGNYVKVEGDKVYASPWYTSTRRPEWRLAYDFSLQPGEGCLIPAELLIFIDTGAYETYRDCYFKFEEMVYLPQYRAEFMKMNVYENEEASADVSKAFFTEYWRRGVGAQSRFTDDPYFVVPPQSWIQQIRPCLKCVTDDNGEIVVEENNWSGVKEVKAQTVAVPVAYYDLQGRRLAAPVEGAITIVCLSDGSARKIVR